MDRPPPLIGLCFLNYIFHELIERFLLDVIIIIYNICDRYTIFLPRHLPRTINTADTNSTTINLVA